MRSRRSAWSRALACCLAVVVPATVFAGNAPDRVPVAVLWMGEVEGDLAIHVVEDVNAALKNKQSARPIDNDDYKRLLVDGGPGAKVTALVHAGEAALAHTKLAEAATAFESAEALLFAEVPFESMRAKLGEVERALLTSYDQMGRGADAKRAAARLRMTPGEKSDLKVLLDRHATPAPRKPPTPAPVEIVSQPPGAQVFRDLQPVGVTPMSVEAGDREVDFVDVEAPGFRRAHVALGRGGHVEVVLNAEDRLSVLVDHVRDQAPDAPPAEVASLGKRVGAVRVLAILPDGPRKLLARWLDVSTAKWADASLRVDNSGAVSMERLAGYAAPNEVQAPPAAPGAQLAPVAPVAPEPPPKRKLGIWGKWYTWVAAGGVVALVVGLLVAQNVGSDKLTVTSTH